MKNSEIRTDGLVTPGWYNLFNSIGPLFIPTDGDRNRKEYEQINSVYGYVDMELYKTFFLNMTARYDKISTLPKGNNEYFYPSVSGSLLLNQLFNLPSWINLAKLRGSYASVTSGKIADDNYGYISAFDKRVGWNGQSAFALGIY